MDPVDGEQPNNPSVRDNGHMSSRKKRSGSKRKSSSNKAKVESRAAAQSRAPTLSINVDALWVSLRTGAANVAGVRYQLAVTSWLLAQHDGAMPVSHVVPEGLEDIDAHLADGTRAYIQTKERAGGTATLTQGLIVDSIVHAMNALDADPRSLFVLITDAMPTEKAPAPGLSSPVEATDELVNSLSQKLERSKTETIALVARCRVVYLSWLEVGPSTQLALAERFDVLPALARIAHARVLDDLGDKASAQRSTSAQAPLQFGQGDLESMMFQVRELVDVNALAKPERDGLIAPVDFTRPLVIDVERFFLGVDVEPGHIAANLDVIRRDELDSIFDGLRDERYALIVAPSGAGKSSLLWRTAHELDGRFRLVRVRAVRPENVHELARYISAQEPHEHAPILVCGDDLGHPSMAGWEDLASRILELPGVHLLGATRQEDFNLSLQRGRARVVSPSLDHKLAGEIVAQLRERDTTLALEPEEAFRRAEGLLMEFLALLVAGRRLEDIIGEQVEQRLAPERATERECLRFTAAAHVAGLSLRAESLGRLVNSQVDLPLALQRLSDELLVCPVEGNRWTGLHEMRSQVVTRRLHRLPPPTESHTFAQLLPELPHEERSHLILHAALRGHDLHEIAVGASRLIAESLDASEISTLLEGFLNAEETVYARRCIEVVRRERPAQDLHAVLSMAIMVKAGVSEWPIEIDGVAELNALAAMLPDRPASHAAEAASKVSVAQLTRIVERSSLESATRFLEIMGFLGAVRLTPSEFGRILAIVPPSADADIRSKVVAACWRLADEECLSSVEDVLGTLENRLALIAQHRRDVLSLEPGVANDEVIVDARSYDGNAVSLHEQLISLSRLIYALCPEVALARVEAICAAGTRSPHPENQKLARREVLLSPSLDIRRNVAFDEAVLRLCAAESWSDRFRGQTLVVEEIAELLDALPIRLLHKFDHKGRRHKWLVDCVLVDAKSNQLPSLPWRDVSASEIQRSDPARTTLGQLSLALSQLAQGLAQGEPFLIGISMQLRDAFKKKAHEGAPTVGFGAVFTPDPETVEWPVARRLREQVEQLAAKTNHAADLLLIVHGNPTLLSSMAPALGSKWSEVSLSIIETARATEHERERSALGEIVGTGNVVQLPAVEHSAVRLACDRWLLFADLEDFEKVSTRLLRIDQELAADVSYRTFLMASTAGVAIPSMTQLFAIRESTPGFWPVEYADAKRLTEDVDIEVFAPALMDDAHDILTKYVRASEAATHARLRAQVGSELEDEHARALAEAARAHAGRLPVDTEVWTAVQAIDEMLTRERDGDETASLASGLLSAMFHEEENSAIQAAATVMLAAAATADELTEAVD